MQKRLTQKTYSRMLDLKIKAFCEHVEIQFWSFFLEYFRYSAMTNPGYTYKTFSYYENCVIQDKTFSYKENCVIREKIRVFK